MTDLEKESLDVLLLVRHFLTIRTINRGQFQDLLGRIRTVLQHFENAASGCPTGTHASACHCKPAVKGLTDNGIQYRLEHRKSA